MDNYSELKIGKTIWNLFAAIGWGVAAMIVGGLIAGWMGATVALCVMCYWKMCVMTMASPLIIELSKTMGKLEKRQTINQALIQDLEDTREELNELRGKFENFQVDFEKHTRN